MNEADKSGTVICRLAGVENLVYKNVMKLAIKKSTFGGEHFYPR